MIHRLLNITRPLIVPDVETTGLDPKEARIIEVGFQVWTADGLQKEWRSLVNPGVPIPPEVTKITGIDDAQMHQCKRCGKTKSEHVKAELHTLSNEIESQRLICDITASDMTEWAPVPTFAQLAPNLAKGFSDCDFAGANVRYDLQVFAAEFDRAHVMWTYAGARIVDCNRLEQLGEPRNLSALYRKHTGKDATDAHQALADVRMTTEVIEAQLKKYATLPRDLDLLHKAQWGDAIDAEGFFKFVDGVPCFAKGKYANKTMQHVAKVDAQYYSKFMLGPNSTFGQDVKRLALDALAGKFPETKR